MALPLAVLLMIASAAIAVLVTRTVLYPRIDEANSRAAEAEGQVASVTKRLETTIRAASEKEALLKAEAAKSSKSNKSSKKDDESKSADGVEDPWVDSKTFSSGDTTLDGEVKAYCDARSDTSMDQGTAALEIYKGIAWSEYIERDDAQKPSGPDWRLEYARKFYENDCTGNCYEFACFLMYCLRYLGYADAQAEAVIVEFQSGSWGDHGLVYVTNTDGSSCLCDTARGVDGWMIPADSYNVEIKNFE